jgi:hypothetical protein
MRSLFTSYRPFSGKKIHIPEYQNQYSCCHLADIANIPFVQNIFFVNNFISIYLFKIIQNYPKI